MAAKKKVLLVEDEEDIIRLVKFTLERRGFEVVVTSDGLSALEIIPKQKPNLVLLDVMMPALDGYETCKRIKQNPQTKEVPVVMLSAKAQSQEREKGRAAGALDFIAKPFNPKELGDKVEQVLQTS